MASGYADVYYFRFSYLLGASHGCLLGDDISWLFFLLLLLLLLILFIFLRLLLFLLFFFFLLLLLLLLLHLFLPGRAERQMNGWRDRCGTRLIEGQPPANRCE